MYCVIQEIELKKLNRDGYHKKLKSEYMKTSVNGRDLSHYIYYYGLERFQRPIKKAYKISIHESYRECGKVKKKQFVLCTVNYYDFASDCFSVYDYCSEKISKVAQELSVDEEGIYNLVETKIEPLIEKIQADFRQTEEYITHEGHERITSLYSINKIQFAEKYQCDKDLYDKIYNVFGDLMDSKKLEEIEGQYKTRKEYEEKSSSYQKEYYSNHNSDNKSSYYNNIHSNHNEENKETLKQFYRVLSKKFHPDANPDADTSKQMQLLNQLKSDWGV